LAEAYATLGLIATFSFQWAEAEAAYRKAIELDPTSPILNHLVGLIRLYARDFDGAIDAFKKTLEMAPNFQVSRGRLGVIYELQGKYTEALAEYDQDAPRNREFLGLTYVRAGRRADALRHLQEMEQRAKREYVSPAARGMTWVALGEKDRGYALLAKACVEKDRALVGAKVEPTFDTLRAEPRFHEVLKCVHLE
jgi:adenylate cyclase